jgi:ubiquitin-protein ligase
MIDLFCPQCGAAFCVGPELGGSEVACKSCGAGIFVPHLSAPDASLPGDAPVDPASGIEPVPLTDPAPTTDDAPATNPAPAIELMPLSELAEPSPPIAMTPHSPEPPSFESPPSEPPSSAPPPSFAPSSAAPSSAPPKIPMRVRRLRSDAQQMARAFQNFELIRVVSSEGDPPDQYVVEYAVRGLQRIPGREEPVPRAFHQAQITLGAEYPRMPPRCRMLTPIFHPNIEPATICVGDHWTAGERLVDLVVRIAELIAFQAYNIQSPLDAEAAMWADLNVHDLPIDQRSMRPAGME